MGDEVIHLLEAPVVMGQRKVVAPAMGHSVDLAHDRCVLLPCAKTSGELTDAVPKRLLCRKTRVRSAASVHGAESCRSITPVGIDHFGLAHAQSSSDRFHRLMDAAPRPKTERLRMEVRLENRHQHQIHHYLHHGVFHHGNAQRP
jgi:hypothetical protein